MFSSPYFLRHSFFSLDIKMETPTDPITRANQAVEKAQSDYDKMLAKVTNLVDEYTKYFTQNNPTASVFEIDQYLQAALKNHYESLARKENVKQELLKQQTIFLQKDQIQCISS